MNQIQKIVIAGASGYIGRAIIPKLLERFPNSEIIALSRSSRKSDDSRVTWKACDLFSLKSLEEVIPPKIDLALYLVHSMGPTAHLDQGSFADYDLLLADNFSKAIQNAGLRHFIYLGGLIPESNKLSRHLQSRLEMEEIFIQYNFPITIFRGGLILGDDGSSFQILLKLVKRLPVMICPRWTQTLTTPVDLGTALKAITESALDPKHLGRVYDLSGCKPITYLEMMRQTALQLGLRRYFFTVPFFTPTLSRLWVSLITNTSRSLIYPLIESLEHSMVAREAHMIFRDLAQKDYSDLIRNVSMKTYSGRSIFHFRPRRKTVRSVQRLPLPARKNAEWVKDKYVRWLPQFLSPLIKVQSDKSFIEFSMIKRSWILLRLKLSPDRSNPDRQLLYITQGLLVGEENQGRLEFRVALNRQVVIAAIHDYTPALPWFLYRYTQAVVHLFVMRAFGKELASTENTEIHQPSDLEA